MRKNKKNWVTVTVDLDSDLLLALALEAHRRDMKLNDYIVELLEKYVKERECQEMI
jgi:hypothetical protein